jgi:hypothetical protein
MSSILTNNGAIVALQTLKNVKGLCCTNRLMAGVSLSPDRLIPRLP